VREVSVMELCMVCNRKLKDPLSIKLKVGPKCRKKLRMDPEILAEIRDQGMDGVPVVGGIQLLIPETPEERGTE
jgi:hypothetical protein